MSLSPRLIMCSLTAILQQNRPWHFDLVSALAGALLAFLLSALAYLSREALKQVWDRIRGMADRGSRYLQASMEENYRERVAAYGQDTTTAVPGISIAETFVEPEVAVPLQCPTSLEELEATPPISISLPFHRAQGEHQLLAILGGPGSGRTSLLTYIAHSNAQGTSRGEENTAGLELHLGRLPLMVWLPSMGWAPAADSPTIQDAAEEDGSTKKDSVEPVDSVDRLLRAAMETVRASGSWSKPVRRYLTAGKAVILMDGWSELFPEQRRLAAQWVSNVTTALPGNLWVVSADLRGYSPLTEAGFVPLRLLPWSREHLAKLVHNWIQTWNPESPPYPSAVDRLVTSLEHAAQGEAPTLELALRTFVYLCDNQIPRKRSALYDRAFELLIWDEENPWLLAACRGALGSIALEMQQLGETMIQKQQIIAAVDPFLPPSDESTTRAAAVAFRVMTGARGIVHSVRGNKYAFAHPLWQAHFAARQLAVVDPVTLVPHLDDHSWAEVFGFYAESANIEPLVVAWLSVPDDIIHSRWQTLVRWVNAAPKEAAWRNGAMRTIARELLEPGLSPSARCALSRALAQTDIEGVKYLFKQAITNPSPEVRAAAAEGLAILANESDLQLIENTIIDNNDIVLEAAIAGLATLRLDAATRLLERLFLNTDEAHLPAVAKALARSGDEGRAFLREALQSDDVMLRRSAVIGLAQIEAKDVLEHVVQEDEQWIVRSAAIAALSKLEKKDAVQGAAPPPSIEQLPWLISWAAEQGEGVGTDEAARATLWRAIKEGEPAVRFGAAQALVRVGEPSDVQVLRDALVDTNPAVVDTALDALIEISNRYDLHIE